MVDYWIPLRFKQVRRRTKTMYLEAVVPNFPLVPTDLRGAAVRIRLNSTKKELRQGINRAEHVRAFPEQHPLFDEWFGIREDAESLNSLLKSQLWGRRLRTADPSRNDLDLALWAFCQNVKAVNAYRQRTGSSSRGDPAQAA